RRPRRIGRQVLAPVPELALAKGVGRVDEVQFVLGVRALEHSAEPRALNPRVAGKVEYDGQALRQERAHVWLERVPQSGGVLDESRNIEDLAGIESVQELVLDYENGILPLGEFSGQRGFSRGHLAAQEDQLCRSAHDLISRRRESAAAHP